MRAVLACLVDPKGWPALTSDREDRFVGARLRLNAVKRIKPNRAPKNGIRTRAATLKGPVSGPAGF